MAFTDVETRQVHDAINTDPTGEDLCKLGLLYSTGGVVSSIMSRHTNGSIWPL